MRYLHGSTKVYAVSSDPEALVYWTKVRPQIVTALDSAFVGPPQVRRELGAQSLRSSRGGADRGRHLVKGERKADHDTAGKDYFVREVAYGAFQRSFALPEGVDGAQVEAKYAKGMLEVRVPAPQAVMPRTIEVKAA
jgi:hypothetical protein